MARSIHKLKDREAKGATGPGRISDGGGLYLRIKPSGAKSWSFIWTPKGGSRKEIGLGPYPEISLADARDVASTYRAIAAKGGDLVAEHSKEREMSFAECVDAYIDAMSPGWTNAKHRYQWEQTLGDAYCKAIRSKPVSEITFADVLHVLKPIWTEKPETATRLRGRIERVLNYAKVKGWRTGENPAVWRGNLDNVLPKRRKRETVTHLAALPYADVPEFFSRLREREATSASALEFLILTAARTGEVINAKWHEIDFQARTWNVPKERMKLRRAHTVPLTNEAMAILYPLHEARISDWVFPGMKRGKPLSNMAMELLLRRMGATGITVHGFRSSFRDWAGDETSFPREVAEAALAHLVGNAVEQAYRRGDALNKRRDLMEAWARYCTGQTGAKVIALHG
ncbi:tyrosine-type recombinase/integrase [Oricola indica]|uniref:tyrosine-type recombinase/integrase n=1 Tax=Oricola indica TaxID=2872591 RepID=UPI003CCC2F97